MFHTHRPIIYHFTKGGKLPLVRIPFFVQEDTVMYQRHFGLIDMRVKQVEWYNTPSEFSKVCTPGGCGAELTGQATAGAACMESGGVVCPERSLHPQSQSPVSGLFSSVTSLTPSGLDLAGRPRYGSGGASSHSSLSPAMSPGALLESPVIQSRPLPQHASISEDTLATPSAATKNTGGAAGGNTPERQNFQRRLFRRARDARVCDQSGAWQEMSVAGGARAAGARGDAQVPNKLSLASQVESNGIPPPPPARAMHQPDERGPRNSTNTRRQEEEERETEAFRLLGGGGVIPGLQDALAPDDSGRLHNVGSTSPGTKTAKPEGLPQEGLQTRFVPRPRIQSPLSSDRSTERSNPLSPPDNRQGRVVHASERRSPSRMAQSVSEQERGDQRKRQNLAVFEDKRRLYLQNKELERSLQTQQSKAVNEKIKNGQLGDPKKLEAELRSMVEDLFEKGSLVLYRTPDESKDFQTDWQHVFTTTPTPETARERGAAKLSDATNNSESPSRLTCLREVVVNSLSYVGHNLSLFGLLEHREVPGRGGSLPDSEVVSRLQYV